MLSSSLFLVVLRSIAISIPQLLTPSSVQSVDIYHFCLDILLCTLLNDSVSYLLRVTFKHSNSFSVKFVLVLGSWYYAKPIINVLAATRGIRVVVACRTLSEAKELAGQVACAISLNPEDEKALDEALSNADLVIALDTYIAFSTVMKSAIRMKTNVITPFPFPNYTLELESEVQKAGIVVFSYLWQGIQQLYSVKTIEEVHKANGKINSMFSYSGSLPTPENSGNPLGYKFSEPTRRNMDRLLRSVRYLKNGKIEEIAAGTLMDLAKPYFIYPGFALVAYPMSDSVIYKKRYKIPEAKTIVCGVLRFQGFPEFINVLIDVGLLNDSPADYLSPEANKKEPLAWKDALSKILNSSSSNKEDLIWAISSKTKFKNNAHKTRVISGFSWLGLFSNNPITPLGNPIDTLCATFTEKMSFKKDERDLFITQLKFEIELEDKSTETRTSTLVEYGVPGKYSAREKLTGIPCAVVARQILKGTISEPGIHAPWKSKFSHSIIEELKNDFGIELVEETII